MNHFLLTKYVNRTAVASGTLMFTLLQCRGVYIIKI